jgi:type I restriction enzyme S subunit
MSDDPTLNEFTGSDGKEPSKFVDEGLREEGFLTLPHDWDISTVREVSKEGGLVDGDWIESADMDESGAIQLVQLGHIGEGRFKGEPNRFITKEFAEQEDCTVLSEGDLLISRMQEPILRSCILPSFEQDSVMAVDIARLQEDENWNRMLLKYIFNSRPIWKQGIAWASGTTRKRISRKNIEKLRLPTPPLSEQRKIATVLYTVDRAIQKTNSIINELCTLHQGWVNKILTEGASSEPVVEGYLGPKEITYAKTWSIEQIGDIADVKGGKRLPKGHNYAEEKTDYPYIRVVDFINGTVVRDDLKYLKEETYNEISKYTISSDDTYISIAGNGLGQTGTVPDSLDGANLTENAAKICELNGVEPEYLKLYLNSYLGDSEIHRATVGTGQPKLGLFRIKNLEVLVPPLPKQRKIVEISNKIELTIHLNREEKKSLKDVKAGLMQDLLSGEVRTTYADIDIPEEIAQYG